MVLNLLSGQEDRVVIDIDSSGETIIVTVTES
jgi:hypothetical protein